MSLRTDLARLDAEYRAGVVRRQTGVTLAISLMFRRLTIAEILGGGPAVDRWLDQSLSISMAVRSKVAEETATYISEISKLTLPSSVAPIHPVIADPPAPEQVRTSLMVTGVVSARKRFDEYLAEAKANGRTTTVEDSLLQAARQPALPAWQPPSEPRTSRQKSLEIIQRAQPTPQEEVAKSGEMAGAAGARHAINVGRDSMIATAQADKRVIGWVRVTSGRPCFFCAALASRGPVYEEDSFDESDPRFEGPGQHKVHDFCSCGLRMVTSRSTDQWPELSQRLEQQWKALSDETNRLYGRNPTMLDWRRQYKQP